MHLNFKSMKKIIFPILFLAFIVLSVNSISAHENISTDSKSVIQQDTTKKSKKKERKSDKEKAEDEEIIINNGDKVDNKEYINRKRQSSEPDNSVSVGLQVEDKILVVKLSSNDAREVVITVTDSKGAVVETRKVANGKNVEERIDLKTKGKYTVEASQGGEEVFKEEVNVK